MNRLRHLFRATKLVLTDQRIPRPLRWVAAFALLPIPGPVDEAALILAVVLLVCFYRDPLRDAWRRS